MLKFAGMAASKMAILPQTGSINGLVEFFETHDMGEYWEQMPEAKLDIDIRHRKHLVALDDDLVGKVAEIARSRHVSSESLVNSLLWEKLADAI
jgi:CopG antitoxin of type II toxin-antitoxin system